MSAARWLDIAAFKAGVSSEVGGTLIVDTDIIAGASPLGCHQRRPAPFRRRFGSFSVHLDDVARELRIARSRGPALEAWRPENIRLLLTFMTPRFVTVLVEEHEDLPDGCCMRFRLVDEPRAVRVVRYDAADWRVESREGDGSTGTAWAAAVEDSGAGTCTLLYGGNRGLRLHPADGGEPIAEPYLLLSRESVVEWAS